MRVLATIEEARTACAEARRAGLTVGFVPTMGAFHAGHRSLMRAARAETDFVVVSLFVNPNQFAPTEDLSAYPRDSEGDEAVVRAVGGDVLFRPSVDEMYPTGPPHTTVHVAGLTDGMCGATRPTHFDGVCTVVAKLFAIVGPCRAYFGHKDYQQLAVVRTMVADLDLPVTVVGAPLVREPDGLAMSSRNVYLTVAERRAAPVLHAALIDGSTTIRAGERNPGAIIDTIRLRVGTEPALELEYVEVRDAQTLAALNGPDGVLRGSFVIAIAARVGRTRLIDNVVVTIAESEVTVDSGVRAAADGPPPTANP